MNILKYKLIKTNDIEKTLNEMVKEGWEFVGFTPFMNTGLLGRIEIIFKKEVLNE